MRFLKLGIGIVGMTLAMLTTAGAQSHRWESLAGVKPGTTLLVGTDNRYGPLSYDRCRMVAADAANLTCMEQGKQGARLVFPASQVEYVSRVTKPFHLWPWLLLAVAGVFVGGLASENATAVGIGIVGTIIAIVAGGVASEQRGFDAAMGRPPAPDERIQLIYRRMPVPVPSGVPAPAATPSLPGSAGGSLAAEQDAIRQ